LATFSEARTQRLNNTKTLDQSRKKTHKLGCQRFRKGITTRVESSSNKYNINILF